MPRRNQPKCLCQGALSIQKHHLFRTQVRNRWKSLAQRKVWVHWEDGTGKEKKVFLPIDIYVKICEQCHKINHPENLPYHLNEIYVNEMYGGNKMVKEKRPTYKRLQAEFERKVKELQDTCPHKSTKWFDHWWAPGHYSGYKVKVCLTCNKELGQDPSPEEREYKRKKMLEEFFKKNEKKKE